MKKCIIALIIAVITGFVLHLNIEAPLMSTMFTVAGVIFSVGMSLVVAMSTQNIRHKNAKNETHEKLNNIIYGYIFSFLLMVFWFAIAMLFKEEKSDNFRLCTFMMFNRNWQFDYPLALLLYIGFCIVYYVFNMWATRKQHYEIEKWIDNENNEEE